MTVKIKLINLDDDVFADGFGAAKVDMLKHEGNVKALDEIHEIIEIDCFKLPNGVLEEIISTIISAYGISKWMGENNLKMTDDNGNPTKE